MLCINEDNGLVTDGPEGELFFAEDGQPAQALLDVLRFLKQVEESRVGTVAACAALKKHQLIQPWPVTCKAEAGEKPVSGLFQIDEGGAEQAARRGTSRISTNRRPDGGLLPTPLDAASANAQSAGRSPCSSCPKSTCGPGLGRKGIRPLLPQQEWDDQLRGFDLIREAGRGGISV